MPRPRSKPAPDPYLHKERMESELNWLDTELGQLAKGNKLVPPGWSDLHRNAPCGPAKEKITIRLDAGMVHWYRSLGMGYQARINAVLRCYMDAVISKYIEPINAWDSAGPKEL